MLGLYVAQGQYDVPLAWQVKLVNTNTQTTDAYRGAGRPEAIYYVERIIDMYARAIGMDPAEVRKKNFFKKDQFPATTAIGLTMDTGDYETNLDALIEYSDYTGLRQMQEAARAEGRLLGIGVSTYVEVCGFAPSVLAEFGFGWDAYGMPTSFSGSGLVSGQSGRIRHRDHRHRTIRSGAPDHVVAGRRRSARDPGRQGQSHAR